jgi:hypothetical protein
MDFELSCEFTTKLRKACGEGKPRVATSHRELVGSQFEWPFPLVGLVVGVGEGRAGALSYHALALNILMVYGSCFLLKCPSPCLRIADGSGVCLKTMPDAQSEAGLGQ